MKIIPSIFLSVIFLLSCSESKNDKLYSLRELQDTEHLFKLDSLPKDLKTVLRLDLSEQGINKIPTIVLKMTKLQELDLSKNRFENLEGIETLRNIQYLNLGMNNFKKFPIEITKLNKLKEVGLWWNDFTDFPKEFYIGNKELEGLDITSLYNFNFDKNLAEVHKFRNLKRLNIGANQIPRLTLNYRYLKNLEEFGYIHQEKFNFQQITDSLTNCKKLKIIHFSGNRISKIPPNIWKLQNLEVLNLYLNNIKTIPNEITKLKKLKELCLSDNPIDTVHLQNFQKRMPNTDIY